MDYFSTLFDKKNMPQLVLAVLFALYLIMGYQMPEGVATMVDSTIGKIVVVVVALMLFAYSNPVLGVLALLVAYQLIKSASVKTGMAGLEEYYPTEAKKWSPFTPTHQFPYTLEQEVVAKMAPIMKSGSSLTQASYKPMLDNLYDASPINASN